MTEFRKGDLIVSRKSKHRLVFVLKILAICGAATFMVEGIGNLYEDTGNDVREKDAERTREIGEIIIIHPDIVTRTKQQEEIAIQEPDIPIESRKITGSMDLDSEDAYLLAKIAMAEAEGEDVKGKALVILVVLNRVWSDKFPDSISEVIFQDGEFSPVGSGRFDRLEPSRECYEALEMVWLNQWDESQGALYFESKGKSDWHRNNLKYLFRHGNHYFYTDKELTE